MSHPEHLLRRVAGTVVVLAPVLAAWPGLAEEVGQPAAINRPAMTQPPPPSPLPSPAQSPSPVPAPIPGSGAAVVPSAPMAARAAADDGSVSLESFLATLSPDRRRYFHDYQALTWQYHLMAERASTLQALCQTGYGPADACGAVPSTRPASPQIAPPQTTTGDQPAAGRQAGEARSESGDLPVVAELSGMDGRLSAILAYPGGRRIAVRTGSELPSGDKVVGVRPGEVLVQPAGGGRIVPLLFAGGPSARDGNGPAER